MDMWHPFFQRAYNANKYIKEPLESPRIGLLERDFEIVISSFPFHPFQFYYNTFNNEQIIYIFHMVVEKRGKIH